MIMKEYLVIQKLIKNYENLNYDYAYLYQRTYSAVNFNQVIKKTKIYDFIFDSELICCFYCILLIIFTLFFIPGIYQLNNCYLGISLISILLCFFFELLGNILLYKYIKSNFFSISYLDLAKMNKNYPLFYKLDFAFMIIAGILFLINLIIIFCNKNVKDIENTNQGEIEDKESLSDQDEIRILQIEQEKEKLRIEKERAIEETKSIRDRNENQTVLIMRQKSTINDLEQRTRYGEEQLKKNEQIKVDMSNQLKDLKLSLEYKNRELQRKDYDLQSQNERNLELRNQLRETISSYNSKIIGLDRDKIIEERTKLEDECKRLKDNPGGNDEENQKKIKEMEKQIKELNRNYETVTTKLKEQRNKLQEKDQQLEVIKEEKEKIEKEKNEIIREKEIIEEQLREKMEEKEKIMNEIEELKKNGNNNVENDEKLKKLEKQYKELNTRVIALQELVKKNIDPKIALPMTIENIRNCMEGGDYFGKSKEELENKIEEIQIWLDSNNYASDQDYKNKINELRFFLTQGNN